jgi:hypothetical protein
VRKRFEIEIRAYLDLKVECDELDGVYGLIPQWPMKMMNAVDGKEGMGEGRRAVCVPVEHRGHSQPN